MKIQLIAVLIATVFFSGCASKPYNSGNLEKNLTVNLNLQKNGGFLTSASAAAGVNNIGKDCANDYKGYVKLSQGPNEIGLVIGQPTLLIVEISHRTMGSGGSMQRGAVITPKAGVRYQIDANYADGMYDFRLYEVGRAGKRELQVDPGTNCKR